MASDPQARRRRSERLCEMLGLEADAGGESHGSLPVDRAQGAVALGRLDRRAGALGNILPGIALVALARSARAGRAGAGLAVVLVGERDAVTLVLAGLRSDRAG